MMKTMIKMATGKYIRKERDIICTNCKAIFTTRSHNAIRCLKCKDKSFSYTKASPYNWVFE